MALGLTRTYTNDGIPVWQNDPDLFQGGFKLAIVGFPSGAVLPAGTPVFADAATRVATVLKTAIAQDTATNVATDYRVKKGHFLAVGDYLALTAGSKAYAITAIVTTNADYDVISVGTTLGATVAAGDIFFISSATGATAAALNVSPNGLTYSPTTIENNANVGVVYDGLVYARRIPGIPASVKTSLKMIVFSESY